MAFVAALSLTCVLANAHRIQPGSSINQRKSHSNILVDPQSESAYSQPEARYDQNETLQDLHDSQKLSDELQWRGAQRTPGTAASATAAASQAASSEHQAHSLIQEQMSITQRLRSALSSEKIKRFREDYLNNVPVSVLSYFAGFALVALSFCSCCLVRRLTSFFTQKDARQQHWHNGNVVYEWDQTPNRATIYIRPPKHVSKSDLDIRISSRHLRVARKGKPSFLREEIYALVNEEMSFWTLRSNGELQIYLRKVKKAHWPAVLLHKSKSGTHDSDPTAMSTKCKFTPS